MFTKRLARASARHPWRTVAVWIFVLAAAALSAKAFLGTALTTQGSFTDRPESIRAQNLIEQRLTGPAKDTELLIVRSRTVTVSDPRFATFVTGLRSSVLALGPGVVVSAPDYLTPGAAGLVSRDRHATLIPVTIARNFDNATAHIARLDQIARGHQRPPFQVLVAGNAQTQRDFTTVAESDLRKAESIGTGIALLVFAFVLGLPFVLLLLVFRSIVIPATAIAMNLLSVGAAYGLLVLVFQAGGPQAGRWIANAFGFQQVPMIEAWLPLFLFSVLFGLSMDYNVFLLSRIREHYLRTSDNAAAVAFGLSRTGGIITGAALIMVAVFGGVALGNLAMMQQMGFGLAVAVLLDATVVRCLLVPGVMKLLGDANWYLPRRLSWLPDLSAAAPAEPPAERRALPVPAGPRT